MGLLQEVSTLPPAFDTLADPSQTLRTNAIKPRGLLRCMTFIDGSWLYHNQEMLAKAYTAPYKIDFGKINVVVLHRLRQYFASMFEFDALLLDLVRTNYYASVPWNVHPEGEPNFLPKERTIDMALGVNMLYLAALDAYDIAIAVLGDADYQPALDRVRQLGKRGSIFTIGGSAAYEYLYPKATARYSDFPVVRLQDHLEELRLAPRVEREKALYAYACARCGKVFESTYKAAPKQNMYCDEHRIWRDRAGSGNTFSAKDPISGGEEELGVLTDGAAIDEKHEYRSAML